MQHPVFVRNISIVILSFDRTEEFEELFKNLYGLELIEQYVKEIIVINNGSSVSYSNVEQLLLNFSNKSSIDVKYKRLEENRGVSGGRNDGIRESSGDYLLFLDDDSWFESSDSLIVLENYVRNLPSKVGVISFSIQNFYSKEIVKCHKRESYSNKGDFYTYYFIGCGHLIKRELIDAVGIYTEDFFYGAEEYDLCYKAINSGFEIYHTDKIRVIHKVSENGRNPSLFISKKMTMNKWRVAYKYFPFRLYLSNLLLWGIWFLRNSNFNIIELKKLYIAFKKIKKEDRRSENVLNMQAKSYLKRVQARLTY